MDDGPLKRQLQECSEGPFKRTDFSIGHRGAALQFPEHTKESHEAAARMGAGILECDVTFTKDRQLVCRHSQCDLHTTTNILAVPELAAKAVYLDDRVDQPGGFGPAVASLPDIAAQGVNIVAPPMWALLELDASGKIVPSDYAVAARAARLDLITWTLERSGPLRSGGGYYYQAITSAINHDGDMLNVLDVLAKQVKIRGIFSDWPATVTYYANCMGL